MQGSVVWQGSTAKHSHGFQVIEAAFGTHLTDACAVVTDAANAKGQLCGCGGQQGHVEALLSTDSLNGHVLQNGCSMHRGRAETSRIT